MLKIKKNTINILYSSLSSISKSKLPREASNRVRHACMMVLNLLLLNRRRLAMQANITIKRAYRITNSEKSGKIFVKLFKNGPREVVNRIDQITRAHSTNIAIASDTYKS